MKAEALLPQPEDSPVLDDLSLFVAEAGIHGLLEGALCRIPGNHAVDESQGVRAVDIILVKRRDVDQGCGISDGVILAVVHDLIGAGHEIAGPDAPVVADAEGGGARVKWRPDRHKPLPAVDLMHRITINGW